MNDDFIEYMVKKKMGTKEIAIRIALFIVMLALLATFPWFGILSFIAAAVVIFITIKFVFPATDIEYEYLYCDKNITVDKIMGQNFRKTVGEYNMEKVQVVAPVGSHRLDEYERIVTKTVELWSGMDSEEHKPYAIIIQGNTKVILDLPEKFVKMMWNDAPRKVFMD